MSDFYYPSEISQQHSRTTVQQNPNENRLLSITQLGIHKNIPLTLHVVRKTSCSSFCDGISCWNTMILLLSLFQLGAFVRYALQLISFIITYH